MNCGALYALLSAGLFIRFIRLLQNIQNICIKKTIHTTVLKYSDDTQFMIAICSTSLPKDVWKHLPTFIFMPALMYENHMVMHTKVAAE